jgi:adenosylhomocysteine nucleosidase
MRFLVTFATTSEFAMWRSRHPFVPYEFDDLGERRVFDLFKANMGAQEVSVLLTGIGGDNAKKAMNTVLPKMYDICISTGLAGALQDKWSPGDVVVARTAKKLADKVIAKSEPDLVEVAVECGAAPVDVFLSSDTIIREASEKEELSASGGVVEMESAHVLAVAAEKQVAAVAVRAISDAADEDLPLDFGLIVDSRGHVKVGGLLKELALQPYQLVPLVRFGRRSRAASRSLADFLDRYIPAIASRWRELKPFAAARVSAT